MTFFDRSDRLKDRLRLKNLALVGQFVTSVGSSIGLQVINKNIYEVQVHFYPSNKSSFFAGKAKARHVSQESSLSHLVHEPPDQTPAMYYQHSFVLMCSRVSSLIQMAGCVNTQEFRTDCIPNQRAIHI